MKGNIFIPFLFVLLLLLGSCNASRCDLVDCQNGGVCEEGTCICETGYYGDLCEQTWISKFLGNYLGDSQCVERQVNSGFMSQSSLSGIITNFENTGYDLNVLMVNNLRFEYDSMVLGGNRYTGYGEIQPDLSLKLVYTVERNFGTIQYEKEFCKIILEKF